MKERLKPVQQALQFCADCVLLLACWALWLGLGALLALQVAVIVSKEFTVPAFALRNLEQRFTASGVNAHFGRATFDVRGGILLEDLRLSLPEFAEPIINVRALYVVLDPWLLLAGRFESLRVQATGATWYVPAMLAPSGRHEEILRDLDCSLAPAAAQVGIEHASGQLAGVVLAVRGAFFLPPAAAGDRIAPIPLLQKLARHYADLSRQLIRVREQLAAFEQPQLDAVLRPAPGRGAQADLVLTAAAVAYPKFRALEAANLRVVAQLPLAGNTAGMSPLQVSAGEVRLAGAVARQIEARVQGLLNPGQFYYSPRTLQLTARDLAMRGFIGDTLIARLTSPMLPAVEGELIARTLGAPLSVTGQADLTAGAADARLRGALAPGLLDPLGQLLRRDLRRFVDFAAPVELDAQARFAPGWRFEGLTGHVATAGVDAYNVAMDSVEGDIEFDGRHFLAHHARARLGENFARGSFAQDLQSREFRFLLEGRLRPAEIGGWFRPWWSDFFEHFEFPDAPPDASVDVSGRWRSPWQTTVFLYAESSSPVIRGGKLDYARTLMFIRPNFIDGLELYGTRNTGDVRGTFTRSYDSDRRDWSEISFAFDSSIDLETGAKLLGPKLGPRLAAYRFAEPPRLTVNGRFDGPAAASGEHQNLRIDARSHGEFSVYEFPGQNLSFAATLKDDDLLLEQVSADIAGGLVTGRARIWGAEPDRRVGFDAVVSGASLGQAVTTVSRHLAHRRGESETRAERLLPGKNSTKLDLALSAEGRVNDALSFAGSGNVSVAGPELGEVRLLGLLSDLLNFTALRFTHAQGDFKLEGPTVTFRSVNATGANSAIHAKGTYSLARSELDFNARVYPFQESTSLLQSVVGVMLTPLSAVLEVRLTGALDEPKWAFVIGPTNLLRALAEPIPPDASAAGSEPSGPSSSQPQK